jgi:hypothetical protein
LCAITWAVKVMTEPNNSSERERMAARLAKFIESETPERVAERKRIGARGGHVKRKLKQGEPLEGELLKFAVETVEGNTELAAKLKAGQPLNDYDLHLIFDMYLLHARLG